MTVRHIVKSIQDIMRKDAGVDGDAQRLSQLCWMFFLKIVDDQDQQLTAADKNYRSPIPRQFRWRAWASAENGLTGTDLLNFINEQLFPSLKALPISGKSPNQKRVVRSVFEDAYNYMKNGLLLRQVVNKINEVDFNNLAERKHFGDIYEQLLNDLQAAGNSGEFYTPRALTMFMVDRVNPKPGQKILDPSCGTGGFLTCSIRYMRERYVKKQSDELALQSGLRAIELKQLPHMLCVTNMLLHGVRDASFVHHDNALARRYESYQANDLADIIVTNPPFGASIPDGVEINFPPDFRSKESADLFLSLIIKLLKKGGQAAVVLPNGILSGEGVKARIREHLLSECNLHTIVRLPDSVFKPYASVGTNILFFEKGHPTKDIWFYEHRVPEGQKMYSMTRPIKFEHLQSCIEWWGGNNRVGRKETDSAWKVSLEQVKASNFSLDFKNPYIVAQTYTDPNELATLLGKAETDVEQLRDQLKFLFKKALRI
ncbi:HsdM family class I SAM-dependent methyltransferase [Herbaspirillum aquaticum]|uniref:class I SAM-dependent DNA methyltransferase n=1 Tax=Herbaspirillum aquaticum TaxID=568783 RepID=UPI0024DE7127|nr:class I SAM-dependent DNA methyltransferase [Herbaspirillum aquaticum]